MYAFPNELWDIIKKFQLDYRKIHKTKMLPSLEQINGRYASIYKTWSYWPVKHNTNDIIRERYSYWRPDIMMIPRPNLELTSITWDNGWWCEYGWCNKKNII